MGAMTPGDDVPLLQVRVMGVTIAIDAADRTTHDRLSRQWSRAAEPSPVEVAAETIRAEAGESGLARSHDYALTTQVTLAALRATAGRRFNLHAGALADAQGRVLAIVASSGTGKTTATRLLAERLDYLSDETVSITPDGVVHPHAKPLSVITDPKRPLDKEQLSPDALGLRATPVTGRIARFVVLRRGVPSPRGLVRLTPTEGLLNLIEQSSSVAEVPDPLFSLWSLMDAAGGVWALEYDEIHEHLDELERLLAEDLAPTGDPRPRRHPGSQEPVEVPITELQRHPWVDAVEIEDEVLILYPTHAVRLDGLMASLWLELARPSTLRRLVVAAEASHGEHPDADDLVKKAIAMMTEQQLVAWGTLA